MEHKYIDADVLKQTLDNMIAKRDGERDVYVRGTMNGLGMAELVVHNMPAADVELVRKWQSIKKPPEKQGDYLVMDNDGNIFNCEYFVDYEAFGYEQGYYGYYDPTILGFLDSEFCKVDIAFWMELPEPPKVDGGSE